MLFECYELYVLPQLARLEDPDVEDEKTKDKRLRMKRLRKSTIRVGEYEKIFVWRKRYSSGSKWRLNTEDYTEKLKSLKLKDGSYLKYFSELQKIRKFY